MKSKRDKSLRRLVGPIPVESIISVVRTHLSPSAKMYNLERNKSAIFGVTVKISSPRLITFATKGVICVKCGLTASHAYIEQPASPNIVNQQQHGPHISIYAIDSAGDEVLMTVDHIIPSSKGGKTSRDNLQTMCGPCNWKKGDKL